MRIHHLALGAKDVSGVAEFYRDVFGLEERARHHQPDGALRSIWLAAEGVLLMIEAAPAASMRTEAVGSGLFLLAFAVTPAERAEFEARLERRGHAIESRTDHSSYARDPEGNRIAVSHYPELGPRLQVSASS